MTHVFQRSVALGRVDQHSAAAGSLVALTSDLAALDTSSVDVPGPDECVSVDELVQGAQLYAGLMGERCGVAR